jgi:alkylhydroperoxidase/carboxymuconolactone decarboxylase family protein YurZ
VLRDGTLDPLVAELALVCVNAAEHRSDYAEVHVTGARRLGATEAQLVETGICSIAVGGVAAWLAASLAIEATRP